MYMYMCVLYLQCAVDMISNEFAAVICLTLYIER
jgi:hypothetical protein